MSEDQKQPVELKDAELETITAGVANTTTPAPSVNDIHFTKTTDISSPKL